MQHPHETTLFCGEGGVLSPFYPKYGTILLKFRPEVVSHKTKAVSKKSFKIKGLSGNEMYPKLKVLVHFWAQFIPGKPKILPKTGIFPEATSLWLSKNTSTSYQINHRILIKLINKIHFRGKNGLFKIKHSPVNKNQEVRGQVKTIFSKAPNSGLTIGQRKFIVARLKLVLFKFWCHFFSMIPTFLTVDQFLGVTPNQ